MPRELDPLSFLKTCGSIQEVLTDRHLAALEDAYVNFIYSLALSGRKGKPEGEKVKGGLLAEALRKAELRRMLSSRVDKHDTSDAAESLIVYAWLKGLLALDESVCILREKSDLQEGLILLLKRARELLELRGLFEVPR